MAEKPELRSVSYARWVQPAPGSLGCDTQHLPPEVVGHPFMLALDERQHPTEPRIGGLWFSLNFDGRLNPPDLTEQEKEYIRAVLNEALAALPGHDCEEGLVCEEHPATGWPHEDCGGAGMPCSVPDHSGMRPT